MFFLKVFYNTPCGGLELKLSSITILRTVLYGEIMWGVVISKYLQIPTTILVVVI